MNGRRQSLDRAARAARRLPDGLRSRARTKAATAAIRRARGTLTESASSIPKELEEKLTVLMSLKVTSSERLSILELTLRHLTRALGQSRVPILVDDASDRSSVAADVRAMFQNLPMHVGYENSGRPMTQGYLDLLAECETEFCYLQFDDQLTTNLSPPLLEAASEFLERYGGLVPVVSATWPTAVDVGDGVITVTTYEVASHRSRTSYRFQSGRPIKPLFVEKVGGHTFGVFENFMYGFYFNHIIVPVSDYKARLRWYIDHVDATSVHRIEVAAARKTLGPFWTHVAVCLDDVAILDLDFQHTPAAVRPVTTTPHEVFQALQKGWTIQTRHRLVAR